MCGIAGFVDVKKRYDAATLRALATAMTDAVHHRGPDGGACWDGDHVALGHRRLAIVDLTPSGLQPMHSVSGRYVIVFNGEIYNFLDIRQELEQLGIAFRGTSDTEVMLAAFEQWGIETGIQKFAGMFACALFDRNERMLHLFRDRLGKKPLYFGYAGDHFAFASELKSFHTLPGFTAEQDMAAHHLFTRHNFIPAPWSIYKGIFKLPQATCLSLSFDDIASTRDAQDFLGRARPYWNLFDLPKQPVQNISADDAISGLEDVLGLAVRQRMIADVPLGAFLSGGIDSSLIVALMQKQASQPVKTYSIGFAEASHNEAVYARAVADHLKTDHTEFTVTADEARSVIPQLPDIYDEPFADASQIPTWHVCRLARQSVTVALSGDGGDETFGGYNRYRLAQYVCPPLLAAPRPIRHAVSALHKYIGHQNARRLFETFTANDAADYYRNILSYWQSTDGLLLQGHDPVMPLPRLNQSVLRSMMMYDAAFYLPDDILAKVDRASMAVSLETRAPLLDHRVLEYAWTLPDTMKMRGGKGKWILRQLLARHVPPEFFERPKQGFGIPLASWLRGPLAPWMQDLLSEDRLRAQGLYDPAPVALMVRQHLAGTHDWSYRLWGLTSYQAWHDRWRSGIRDFSDKRVVAS